MRKAYFTILFIFTCSLVFAQFEKKLTFDFSVGYAIPTGKSLKPDRIPYFFSNLNSGIAIIGDAQYNFDPHISAGLQVEYNRFFSWSDPREGSSLTSDNSNINLVSFNPFVRYRILKGNISPFAIGSIGFTLYNGEREPVEITIDNFFSAPPSAFYVSIDQVILREPGQSVDDAFAFNTFFGGGLDYNLSQNLGFFISVTYNTILSSNDEIIQQNMVYPLISGGVNLNFVKSKTL